MAAEARGARRVAVPFVLVWVGLHVALAGFTLLLFAAEGRYGFQEAEQEFHLVVRPEAGGPWSVEVPFPRADDADAARVLGMLREEVGVTRGEARLENGSRRTACA